MATADGMRPPVRWGTPRGELSSQASEPCSVAATPRSVASMYGALPLLCVPLPLPCTIEALRVACNRPKQGRNAGTEERFPLDDRARPSEDLVMPVTATLARLRDRMRHGLITIYYYVYNARSTCTGPLSGAGTKQLSPQVLGEWGPEKGEQPIFPSLNSYYTK